MNNKSSYYILKDHIAVPCSFKEWALWFENADRLVAKDLIGPVVVSTVFLGLDYNFNCGPPILFETMIFSDEPFEEIDGHINRYETWYDAEQGHAKAKVKIEKMIADIDKTLDTVGKSKSKNE